jgi:hypothetical protein
VVHAAAARVAEVGVRSASFEAASSISRLRRGARRREMLPSNLKRKNAVRAAPRRRRDARKQQRARGARRTRSSGVDHGAWWRAGAGVRAG